MMNEFEKRLQYQLESNQEEIDNFNDMVFMSMEQDYQECDNQNWHCGLPECYFLR